jgi:hypothetical protein
VQLAYENRKLKDRAAHKESTAFESHFEAKVPSQVELLNSMVERRLTKARVPMQEVKPRKREIIISPRTAPSQSPLDKTRCWASKEQGTRSFDTDVLLVHSVSYARGLTDPASCSKAGGLWYITPLQS